MGALAPSSDCGYVSGYQGPIRVEDQIDILRSHWPRLNPDKALCYMRDVYPKLQLPSWVEGPFALIRPGLFSGDVREDTWEVLRVFKANPDNEVHECDDTFGFRHYADTTRAHNTLMEQQPDSDILIVAFQFGTYRRGDAIGRIRENSGKTGEFAGNLRDVTTMLLTHPNRLKCDQDLDILCAGDSYEGMIASATPKGWPSLSFWNLSRIKGGTDELTGVWLAVTTETSLNERIGIPTGFVPHVT